MTSLARTGNYCLKKSNAISVYGLPNQLIEGFAVSYGYATVYDIAMQRSDIIEILNIPFRSEQDAKKYADLITSKDYQCFACKSSVRVTRKTINNLLQKVQMSEEKLINLLGSTSHDE